MVTIDDFKKLEIRIGMVVSAEKVADADKLVKFVFDLGGGEQRQIIAGIAEFVSDPSTLIGKQMPLLINLESRTFRGHESQGMIVAVDVDGRPVFLYPSQKVPSGSIVK